MRLLTWLSEAVAADAEQQVVLLYYMSEQSHTAIAEFLGVSTNTAKTRLYAARQRPRKYMADIEKDPGAAGHRGTRGLPKRFSA